MKRSRNQHEPNSSGPPAKVQIRKVGTICHYQNKLFVVGIRLGHFDTLGVWGSGIYCEGYTHLYYIYIARWLDFKFL